jgi:trimethylguanosine synthase
MPNGDCGDGIVNPHPKEEVPDKFWSQRRRLFSRFDQGILLDKESWFSVTPEAIADHIAARLVVSRNEMIVLEPFAGCGGNSLAFARRKEIALVVCVDTDIEKLKKAATNARIYEIPPEKIVFIHDDACRVMSSFANGTRVDESSNNTSGFIQNGDACEYKIGGLELLPEKIDTIFFSPPWGGMDYAKVGKRNYDLSCIQLNEGDNCVNGEDILELAAKALGNKPVAYFLPRNTNGVALAKSALKAGFVGPVELEQNILNGKLKTITVYLGL